MPILINKDVRYSNINQNNGGITNGGKISGMPYVIDDDGNIQHSSANYVVNAIDIDWNNATYKNKLGPIKSTSDLISIIGQTKEKVDESIVENKTPYIKDGYWWIGDTNTNIPASDNTPYVGENGNWWIGDTDTGVTATNMVFGASDGIPIYDPDMIAEREAKGVLPEKYISIGDSREANTSLITSLLSTVNALQQEVEKLKNSFTRGIYSYNNEATFISSVVNKYGDEEEPLWAIDESELDKIEGLEISENTYEYTDTNNVIKNCQDCRLYSYISANNLNIEFTIKNVNNNDVSHTILLSDIIHTDKNVNVLIIISRKLNKLHYPVNFVYVSVSDQNDHSKIARGYLNLDKRELIESEYDVEVPYYLYEINASNANASKLNIYSQDKEIGNDVQAEVPGDDEETYRVAHIAIRSVRDTETLAKVKSKLVNNELVFDEDTEKLYIKINNKLINIGAPNSSDNPEIPDIPDDPVNPDDPWSEDETMTNQEIIKALAQQGIITIHYVDSTLTDDDDNKYLPSNIIDYTFNKIGSVEFINEDTGKIYRFSADAYGELKSKLIDNASTFESIIDKYQISLPDDLNDSNKFVGNTTRGFIGNVNYKGANISDMGGDRKLKSDRIRIGAIYAPLVSDIIYGCSHAYIELENTSDVNYNLEGCGLHFIKYDTENAHYIKYTLPLHGIIKGGSTYLIRGKKYISNDNDPNCFIHVNTYDQEWYVDNELIDLSINNDLSNTEQSYVFVLSYLNLSDRCILSKLGKTLNYDDIDDYNYLGDATSEKPGNLVLMDALSAASPAEGDTGSSYNLPTGLIDAIVIGTGRYGLSNVTSVRSKVALKVPYSIKSNCIYKNTFELDPAKQAFNGFGSKDSSRVRWQNNANDFQYLILNNEYIEFPKTSTKRAVNYYTPKASFENKNVCTDKTKFDHNKPNAVTVSFGENIYTTRCFNWLSGSYHDEYVWILDEDGNFIIENNKPLKFESYKYTENDITEQTGTICHRKEYPSYVNNIAYCDYRINPVYDESQKINGEPKNVHYEKYAKAPRACGIFAATNDFYVSHKCVIEFNALAADANKKKYMYIVGQSDKNGYPLSGYCSEKRSFTIYSTKYIPRLYQISDQQGFHWIEYQVWAAAALKLNEKITNDINDDPNILPIILNTGDLTQSGSRINEWLDYFIAGDVLFNHFEQNNLVGNNDLNGTDIQYLGTGDDDGKSNPYYFYLFNCIDVNNFFNDGEDHYPIVNNVYVPSLYYIESNDIRFVIINSEITLTNCKSWYNLKYNNVPVNIYTGYVISKNDESKEYAANKNIENGATYNTFTPIYTLLWHAFNSTSKKRMAACHEMPFTVITHKCIAENDEQLPKFRSESDAKVPALIGSHMNQIDKSESGVGTYWFSRLLESSKVKLCIGGHKHTYAITYPLRENYKYKVSYDQLTDSYIEYKDENDQPIWKSSLWDGPMKMGPSLEHESGNVIWKWIPNNTYINEAEGDPANEHWRTSEYPWFYTKTNNKYYHSNINWSKFPITYRGVNFINYNKTELSNNKGKFYPCIPKYNFDITDPKYLEYDKYDEYYDNAVTYIMCQATGYKLKSNKELPTPYQKFSRIIPQTKPNENPGKNDGPSNNQLFPIFIEYKFENDNNNIICKTQLCRITNIFSSDKTFDQSKHDFGLSISNMTLQYLVDKSFYDPSIQYDHSQNSTGNTNPSESDLLAYDDYGLWAKVPQQMINDIIL